jgi:surface antigen
MRKKGVRLAGAMVLAMTTVTVPVDAAHAQAYLQCVPFARKISGIDLFGRAASWWHKAVGRYEQGSLPRAGAVLVFKAISSMRSGHVATVSRVVSSRVIEVTHANWSIIHGRRGQIERNVKVVDVSPANDWSKVRVWWAPHRGLGTTNYPTYGFIYSDKASKPGTVPDYMLTHPVMVTIRPPAPRPMWSIVTAKAVLPAKRPWGLITASAQLAAKPASFARPALVTLSPPAPRPMWPTKPVPAIAPPAPPAKLPLEQLALR